MTCFEVFTNLGSTMQTLQCAECNYFANNDDFSVFIDLAEAGTGQFSAAYDGLDLFGGPDPNNALPTGLVAPFSADTEVGRSADASGITEFTVTHKGRASSMPRAIENQTAGYDTRSRVVFKAATTSGSPATVPVTVTVSGDFFLQDNSSGGTAGACFAGANFDLMVPGGGGPSFDGLVDLDLEIAPPNPAYSGDFTTAASHAPAGANAFDVTLQHSVTVNLAPDQLVALDSGTFATIFQSEDGSGDGSSLWTASSSAGITFTVNSSDPNVRLELVPPPSSGDAIPRIVNWRQVSRVNDLATFDLSWTSSPGSRYRLDSTTDGRTWTPIPGSEDVASGGSRTDHQVSFDLASDPTSLVRVVRKE